jgi:predicted MFS family arabinose efflux permease
MTFAIPRGEAGVEKIARRGEAMTSTTEAATEHPQSTRLSPYRWYILAVLTLLFTLHHVDRNLVSVLAEPIKREYGLSDTQLGTLTGLVFAISYAIAGVPVGLLIDRTNRVRLGAAALAIWSVLTLFSGIARSYLALILARVGVAGAESAASPVGMSLVTDLFPKQQRATAMGFFYASTPIGLAIGYSLGGIVAAQYGWRSAFFFAGIPGVVLALLMILTVREPKRGAFEAPAAPAGPKSSLWSVSKTILTSPVLFLLLLASMLGVTGQAGMSAFLAPFFIRIHGLPIGTVGILVGATLGAGGLLGMPIGGMIADRLGKTKPGRPSRFVALAALIAAPVAAAGFLVPSVPLAVGLIGTYSLLASTYYGSTYSSFMSNAPVSVRGAAGAFMIVILNLVGYGAGPQLSGLFSDTLKAHHVDQPLRWALVIMTGFYILAAAFFWLAGWALDRKARREAATAA